MHWKDKLFPQFQAKIEQERGFNFVYLTTICTWNKLLRLQFAVNLLLRYSQPQKLRFFSCFPRRGSTLSPPAVNFSFSDLCEVCGWSYSSLHVSIQIFVALWGNIKAQKKANNRGTSLSEDQIANSNIGDREEASIKSRLTELVTFDDLVIAGAKQRDT